MQVIAIIALCVASAVVYGVVHDQVTARVCVEYFTIGHPHRFDTDSPTMLGIGWGIIATWWVGLLLGIPLAIAARVGEPPRRDARSLVRPIAALLAIMGGCAALAGLLGFVLGSIGAIELIEPLGARVPRDRHARFLADGGAHLASYLVGLVGGLVVIALVWRSRRRDREDLRGGRRDAASGPRPGSPVAGGTTIRSVLLAACVLSQAAVLPAAGVATLRLSEDLAYWLIHRVGEEYALGAVNVAHLEDGGVILTNLNALFWWTIPIWALGLVQISAALSLIGLWSSRPETAPLPRWSALLLLLVVLVVLLALIAP